jgi:hypothetical protein
MHPETERFLRAQSPVTIIDFALVAIPRHLGHAHPVDLILHLFPSSEEFGLSVLSRIFGRDELLLPAAAHDLAFFERYSSNPDPVHWGVQLLRHKIVETVLSRARGEPVLPDQSAKPTPSLTVPLSVPARPVPAKKLKSLTPQ